LKIYAKHWQDYELIDAGGGRKLERWGTIITIRPDINAYFPAVQPIEKWQQLASWEFREHADTRKGFWVSLKDDAPDRWLVGYDNLKLELSITNFKHVGLFPEQEANWSYLKNIISPGNKVLNLFAYTGAVSCLSKASLAETTHVDAVKQLISWARTNMEHSGLQDIRWMHEDALKFVAREAKRGNVYDVIVMDPPAWGIGANKEKWKIEDKLGELMELAYVILKPGGHLILNTYSPKVDTDLIEKMAYRIFDPEKIEVAELWSKSTTNKALFHGCLMRAKK
jgi:23S rRNA (cytosine1962-C5)-methyltransferase